MDRQADPLTAIPLGITLSNPGDIERDGDVVHYDGEAIPSRDPIFKEFIAPEWGLRAIVVCLQAYIEKDGVNTLGAAIARWAPPADNDTVAYQAHVCADCAATNATPFTLAWLKSNARTILRSIVVREIGSFPYTDATLELAIELAWPEQ
jgi:hypothetical protein